MDTKGKERYAQKNQKKLQQYKTKWIKSWNIKKEFIKTYINAKSDVSNKGDDFQKPSDYARNTFQNGHH